MAKDKILIWLPSPLGDAVLATPALRSMRDVFADKEIFFLAGKTVQQVLSPSDFCDQWYCPADSNPIAISRQLKKYNFTCAVLLKNSFSCAISAWLAGIPTRVGYSRQGRGMLLTSKLYAPKIKADKFKPVSMVDYYLAIASWLGGDCENRNLELKVDGNVLAEVEQKIGLEQQRPIVILVPGGAFGPSKCWASQRFAQTADLLIEKYNAQVLINVAPNQQEMDIAEQIIGHSKNKLVNLGKFGFSLEQIKAAISKADLVITNDTGPRHIAVALGRKVITLFGPNDPAWTDTGWEKEIQIVGKADCSPCAKKICFQKEHICMNDISVEQVVKAARRLMDEC